METIPTWRRNWTPCRQANDVGREAGLISNWAFKRSGEAFSLGSPEYMKITPFTVLKTSAFSKSISLLRSASLPPQHAQHRRVLGTPELRAGLRRKEKGCTFLVTKAGELNNVSPLPGLWSYLQCYPGLTRLGYSVSPPSGVGSRFNANRSRFP
jgi:hypothetical protein